MCWIMGYVVFMCFMLFVFVNEVDFFRLIQTVSVLIFSVLTCRCESAGGHRKRSVAAGSKWSGKGVPAHQQATVSTNGRT